MIHTSLADFPDAQAILKIDLEALCHNWRFIDQRIGAAECSAVVKANAYGLGVKPVVTALRKTGCRTYFVAHISEGQHVRQVAPDAIIYMLHGFLAGAETYYHEYDLRPVLSSYEEIRDWIHYGRSRGKAWHPEAALHINTGMNRLGISWEEVCRLLSDSLCDHFSVALVMSHFIASEEQENPLNDQQIAKFEHIGRLIPGKHFSLCNSSGIFLKQKPFYDMVRLGYGLYGGNPCPGQVNPMRSVVDLRARILTIRNVQKGESAGYNSLWHASRDSRLAVIAIGYADGVPRNSTPQQRAPTHKVPLVTLPLSYHPKAGSVDLNPNVDTRFSPPGGYTIIEGIVCPFVGRVSMDLTLVDITDLPPQTVQCGDCVQILGPDISIEDLGNASQTNGYEILTNLGQRYPRVYF